MKIDPKATKASPGQQMLDRFSANDEKSISNSIKSGVTPGNSALFTGAPSFVRTIFARLRMVKSTQAKQIALERFIFNGQDRFVNELALQAWLRVGSGWCSWAPGPNGGIIPVASPQSYWKLCERNMILVHQGTLAFLRTERALKFLLPSMSLVERENWLKQALAVCLSKQSN